MLSSQKSKHQKNSTSLSNASSSSSTRRNSRVLSGEDVLRLQNYLHQNSSKSGNEDIEQEKLEQEIEKEEIEQEKPKQELEEASSENENNQVIQLNQGQNFVEDLPNFGGLDESEIMNLLEHYKTTKQIHALGSLIQFLKHESIQGYRNRFWIKNTSYVSLDEILKDYEEFFKKEIAESYTEKKMEGHSAQKHFVGTQKFSMNKEYNSYKDFQAAKGQYSIYKNVKGENPDKVLTDSHKDPNYQSKLSIRARVVLGRDPEKGGFGQFSPGSGGFLEKENYTLATLYFEERLKALASQDFAGRDNIKETVSNQFKGGETKATNGGKATQTRKGIRFIFRIPYKNVFKIDKVQDVYYSVEGKSRQTKSLYFNNEQEFEEALTTDSIVSDKNYNNQDAVVIAVYDVFPEQQENINKIKDWDLVTLYITDNKKSNEEIQQLEESD